MRWDFHNLWNKRVIGLRALCFCVFRNDVIYVYDVYVKNMADALKIACLCEDNEFLLMSSLQENDVKGLNLEDLSEELLVSKKRHSSFVWCIVPSEHFSSFITFVLSSLFFSSSSFANFITSSSRISLSLYTSSTPDLKKTWILLYVAILKTYFF